MPHSLGQKGKGYKLFILTINIQILKRIFNAVEFTFYFFKFYLLLYTIRMELSHSIFFKFDSRLFTILMDFESGFTFTYQRGSSRGYLIK